MIAAASAAAARTVLGLAPVAASGSATDLTTGTLPDARLRAGLQSIAVTVTDLNTLTQTGVYKAAASATGSAGNSGTYLHLQFDASYAVQVFYHVSSTLCLTRIIAAGVPGSWEAVYNTAAFLNPVYAQVAGPTADKGQALGTAARRYSDVRASAVTVGGDAETSSVVLINGAAASNKLFRFRSANVDRWALLSGATTDNFVLNRYNDSGVFVDTPMTVDRTNGVLSLLAPLKNPSFTVATLPAASAFAQCQAYVSNGTGNKRLAVSDGTNWRFPDGAIVS
ncbi:hypothetical protein ASD32_05130 [Rhizobium sp. Root483D2]|nr:hypothetical protein ASD32_05130 [Rhizobium sp. Root483D2]